MTDDSSPSSLRKASVLDTLGLIKTVIAPTIAKGVIIRRPSLEALAQNFGLDVKAVKEMRRLRKKYGRDPLLFRLPFRWYLLLLDAKHVSEVLAQTPIPFSTASKEKRAALAHFEPGNVLISDPLERTRLRPMHEHALATGQRVHPFATRFNEIVRGEFQLLLNSIAQEGGGRLGWNEFSVAWFRIVRRIVLGDDARDDEAFTGILDDLRRRANWAFAAPRNKTDLERFQGRIRQYRQRGDTSSLIARFPNEPSLHLESQVAQWLFAFDAAGAATFRTLALLGCHDEYQTIAHEEANGPGFDHPFTRSCLFEAIRLWPTTPAILRELTDDYVLAGQRVAKGTAVIIFTPFFHRDDETLNFANRMVPSIWKDGDALPASGLVPFSAGSAICPGHNLVPMVASLAIGATLSAATISLSEPGINPQELPGSLNHFGIRLQVTPLKTAG